MADPQNNVLPPQLQQLIGMPSATPGMGDPNLDPAMENLIRQAGTATQLGTESFGAREKRITDIVGALEQQRAAQAQVGPRSFQPRFGPKMDAQGQPIQGTQRSLLGKIGEGLLTVGASTGPGQMIQGQLYAKPREEYARRAASIQSLQEQLKEEGQALGAEAGMASRPIYGGARAGMVAPAEKRAEAAETSAEAAQTRARAFAADVQRKINAQDIMNQLNLSRADALKAEAAFKRALPALMRQGFVTKEDVANVLVGEKIQAQAPMIDRFVNWLNGGSFGPTQVQAPGGSQPVSGGSPIPKRSGGGGGPSTTPAKPEGVVKWGRDAQGNPVRLNAPR